MISVIYLVGGSFIDDLAFMILATPIFYPAILKLGYDPIWFGMLVAITVMVGVIIPPMAVVVFIVSKITKTPLSVVYSGVYPFLISLFIGWVVVFLFPGIATFLPNLLMK
jgi:TRAP-type C4-dicarboxylate transport system permease large subunit